MNNIQNFYHSYLSSWAELANYAQNDLRTNAYILTKLVSGFIFFIPVAFVYGMAVLYGRVTAGQTRNEIEERVHDRVMPHFQETPHPNQLHFLNRLHSYSGDLTVKEKQELHSEFTNEHQLTIRYGDHPCIVSIRRQDIFQSGADVIVNAANIELCGGGGIDGAIHDKGGELYAARHRKLRDFYAGKFVSGYAAMIDSGELKPKYAIDHVIAVAGPKGPVSTEAKENELYSCYYNALRLASSQNKQRIAFPSISTGIFQFPKERAAAISLKAIYDFLKAAPNTSIKAISIHFLQHDARCLGDYFLG